MILEYLVKKLSPSYDAKINKDYCIYYRNRFERCTICRDLCKYEAIVSSEDEVKIDNTKCKKCGICKAKCPSQSITIDNFGELDLLKKSKKDTLYIGCKKSEDIADFTFNCLNGLHKEYLAAFFILNKECEIFFELSGCKTCDMNLSYAFEEQVESVIEFLRDLNIDVKIKFIYGDNEDKQKKQPITRRELLHSIKKESFTIFQDFVANAIEEYYGKNDLNHRKLLLDVISKLENIDTKERYIKSNIFTSFKINDNCDGCGFCEGICPYGAWRIIDNEEEFKLEHNSSKCRGCKLCINLCPNKSIEEELVKLSYIDNEYRKKLRKKR